MKLENKEIIGYFLSGNMDDDSIHVFRKYIYGENGIKNKTDTLLSEDLFKELNLILFKFYINPIEYYLKNLEQVSFSKKEKAIDYSIIINQENFFEKTEKERKEFIQNEILKGLHVMGEILKQKNILVNLDVLIKDFELILLNDKAL